MSQHAVRAVAAVTQANAKAEQIASAAHSRGKDYFTVLRKFASRATGAFANNAIVCFIVAIFPFSFAAGLLAYTVNNSDPMTGFPETHTTWREWICAGVIIASLLSFYAIFLKHQTVLLLTGTLIKWCGVATFVVASFDKEAADSYCLVPTRCTAGNSAYWNPTAVGNLEVAPYLDYTCVVIWLFTGGVIRHRGQVIQAAITAAAAARAQAPAEGSVGGGDVEAGGQKAMYNVQG